MAKTFFFGLLCVLATSASALRALRGETTSFFRLMNAFDSVYMRSVNNENYAPFDMFVLNSDKTAVRLFMAYIRGRQAFIDPPLVQSAHALFEHMRPNGLMTFYLRAKTLQPDYLDDLPVFQEKIKVFKDVYTCTLRTNNFDTFTYFVRANGQDQEKVSMMLTYIYGLQQSVFQPDVEPNVEMFLKKAMAVDTT